MPPKRRIEQLNVTPTFPVPDAVRVRVGQAAEMLEEIRATGHVEVSAINRVLKVVQELVGLALAR